MKIGLVIIVGCLFILTACCKEAISDATSGKPPYFSKLCTKNIEPVIGCDDKI
ncbi:MAG: hypothetical protein AB8G15_22755 [Saprospiraceae bacterium]